MLYPMYIFADRKLRVPYGKKNPRIWKESPCLDDPAAIKRCPNLALLPKLALICLG
jgi:hypothetical protein